jgi:hypothetical protein
MEYAEMAIPAAFVVTQMRFVILCARKRKLPGGNMPITAPALVQPLNKKAAIAAVRISIKSAYMSTDDGPDFLDFARLVEENKEVAKAIRDILDCGEEEDDVMHAFGVGMVAGIVYAMRIKEGKR